MLTLGKVWLRAAFTFVAQEAGDLGFEVCAPVQGRRRSGRGRGWGASGDARRGRGRCPSTRSRVVSRALRIHRSLRSEQERERERGERAREGERGARARADTTARRIRAVEGIEGGSSREGR